MAGHIRIGQIITGYLRHFQGSAPPDNRDMNVDGSSTAQLYQMVNNRSRDVALVNTIWCLMDSNIQWDGFGGIAALTNGIEVGLFDDQGTLQLDFTDGDAWTTNSDLCAGSISALVHPVSGPDLLSFGLNYEKLLGAPPLLHPGWSVRLSVRDNLLAIDQFRMRSTLRG
jgi:hypothetical protein